MVVGPCRFDRFKAQGGLNSVDAEGVKALLDTVGKCCFWLIEGYEGAMYQLHTRSFLTLPI